MPKLKASYAPGMTPARRGSVNQRTRMPGPNDYAIEGLDNARLLRDWNEVTIQVDEEVWGNWITYNTITTTSGTTYPIESYRVTNGTASETWYTPSQQQVWRTWVDDATYTVNVQIAAVGSQATYVAQQVTEANRLLRERQEAEHAAREERRRLAYCHDLGLPVTASWDEIRQLQAEIRARQQREALLRAERDDRLIQSAHDRALELLLSVVPEKDIHWKNKAKGSIYDILVVGSDTGRYYVIDVAGMYIHGNIHRSCSKRCREQSICLAPQSRLDGRNLPTMDAFLGQYLGIATHENEFLSHGNPGFSHNPCRHKKHADDRRKKPAADQVRDLVAA